MNRPKYQCIYCDYSSVAHHYINHLLTHHKEDLAVEKYRLSLQNGMKKGLMVPLSLKIEGGGEDIFRVCFGCNKFWRKMGLSKNHQENCENSKLHRDICKSLLPVNQLVETAETNTPSDTAIKALQDEIKRLEKKIQRLETENKVNGEGSFKYDKIQDVIKEMVDNQLRDEITKALTGRKDEDDDYDINWEDELVDEE